MIRISRSDSNRCCTRMVYRKASHNISIAINRESKRTSNRNSKISSNGDRNIIINLYSSSMHDITSKRNSNSKLASRCNVIITTN